MALTLFLQIGQVPQKVILLHKPRYINSNYKPNSKMKLKEVIFSDKKNYSMLWGNWGIEPLPLGM